MPRRGLLFSNHLDTSETSQFQMFQSDYRLLTHRVFAAEDYGESQSHQHRDGGWYRQQWDGQVKGRHGRRAEQAAVWLHRELPPHPVQSADEWRHLLQKENQSQGDTGGPQVSFKNCAPFIWFISVETLFSPLFLGQHKNAMTVPKRQILHWDFICVNYIISFSNSRIYYTPVTRRNAMGNFF